MNFYKNNKDQYDSDLNSLHEFVVKNYNEKTVWDSFEKIIYNVTKNNVTKNNVTKNNVTKNNVTKN